MFRSLKPRPLLILSAAAGLLALASCEKPKSPYNTTLPTREMMRLVIDPAATEFWKNTGVRDDDTGEHYTAPDSDEGWTHAEAMATTVSEAANLLMFPERVRRLDKKDEAWIGLAQNLQQNALAAKAAAHAHDAKKMFEIGDSLYQACSDCHHRYATKRKGGGPTPPGLPG